MASIPKDPILEVEETTRLQRKQHLCTLRSHCSVLGMDFNEVVVVGGQDNPTLSDPTIEKLEAAVQKLREVKIQRMQRLQDLAKSMLDLWNLTDTPIEEQQAYQHITCNIAASEHEITEANKLSEDFIEYVEKEVVEFKASKMKELGLKKMSELEDICRQTTHLLPVSDSAAIDHRLQGQKTPKPSKNAILPNHVVEEILCRVPATKLRRFNTVCNQWHNLLDCDHRFARNHGQKSPKEIIFLLLKEGRIRRTTFTCQGAVDVCREFSLVDPESMCSAQFDIFQALHCGGFLLCTSKHSSRLVVWNPCSDETRWFPCLNRHNRRVDEGKFVLGYFQEENIKRYKILRFSHFREDFAIYEFSSDSWRTLDVITSSHTIDSCINVSLHGSTYWFAADEAQSNICLLRFDFQTENFAPVPLPYQCDEFRSRGVSVVREEKLSVLLRRNETSKTEVWVTNKLDKTTQVVWSKVLALDLGFDDEIICLEASFLLDEEKKLVIICDQSFEDSGCRFKDYVKIVRENCEVTNVYIGLRNVGDSRPVLLNYAPSIVQIEQ